MFTGEKFDTDEWADLFRKAGARFAGPVAEHHDGFSMWDTKYSEWNAANMGPRTDVVGQLSKSVKQNGMRSVTSFHHAENWFFFPTTDKRYDCSDPRYSGLYGPIHAEGALPSKEFLEKWKGKIIEVEDKYDPDLVWFDCRTVATTAMPAPTGQITFADPVDDIQERPFRVAPLCALELPDPLLVVCQGFVPRWLQERPEQRQRAVPL